MMHLFYCSSITDNIAILSADESAHCIRVLRLGTGDVVQLIDGKGGLFEAIITLPDPKQCQLEIVTTVPTGRSRNFNLHIAIAPTKNMDRFEWFVEKAVEIGIDTITPILCQRSERKVLKTDRLNKLIISTMKQAMVPYLAVLNELTDYKQFINSLSGYPVNRFIAHCEKAEKINLKKAILPDSDTLVLIGPEGDFSPDEIKNAINNRFKQISLGKNRLRTETAGVFVCSAVNLINE